MLFGIMGEVVKEESGPTISGNTQNNILLLKSNFKFWYGSNSICNIIKLLFNSSNM